MSRTADVESSKGAEPVDVRMRRFGTRERYVTGASDVKMLWVVYREVQMTLTGVSAR